MAAGASAASAAFRLIIRNPDVHSTAAMLAATRIRAMRPHEGRPGWVPQSAGALWPAQGSSPDRPTFNIVRTSGLIARLRRLSDAALSAPPVYFRNGGMWHKGMQKGMDDSTRNPLTDILGTLAGTSIQKRAISNPH